jgi:C1A family cysteine protease
MFSKVILALALVGANAGFHTNDKSAQKFMWAQWKEEYGKGYDKTEEAVRFEIFVENLKIVDERNAAEVAVGGEKVHGMTKFSDLSQEEFADRYLNADASQKTKGAIVADVPELPEGVRAVQDWTGTYTTPVKDQGYCGSCWAFSATEQIESDAMRTISGFDEILSPAQITQCDATSSGCGGGWTENAYSYVKRNGGITTDSYYPYPTSCSVLGVTGSCSSVPSSKKVVTVKSYSTISTEGQMASYVESTGPLSVCLDANGFNSYTGGIMSVCGHSVDHCVQAVGVDTSSYWKVRNSWGTSWGESGYIRLAYGSNTCDITNDPTYVTVSSV